MPKIPTYTADKDIYTGSTGPQADPAAFGTGGLTALGTGLNNLSDGLSDLAYQQKVFAAKQKQDAERQWLRNSSTQLERVFSEFYDNEENQTKETFKFDFDEFAAKQINEYSKAAPSTKSSQAFKTHMDGVALTFSRSAGRVSAKTREANAIRGFEEQTANALQSYRSNVSSGVPEATEMLSRNIEGIYADIEGRFGKLAPETARANQERLVRDVVLATAKTDPDFAKEVLVNAPVVNETLRKTLENHIESESQTSDALAQYQAERIMDKALNLGENGQIVPAIDERVVRSAFGKKADAVLARFNDRARDLNYANGVVQRLSDKNAGYQQAELSKLPPDTDPQIINRITQRLQAIQRQQEKDPAGFMRQQNNEVGALYERALTVPDSLKPHWASIAHARSLEYQGYAPAGTPKEEAAKYLNLPERARHIMSVAEAEEKGARLSQGSIKDQLGVINEMLAAYDQDQQFIAFNDLVHFGKVPPALQLAYLNQGKTWLNEYISTALNPEVLAKLTPEKQSEFSEELDKNATWQQFVKSMYADGQRIKEVGAWRSGIIAYGNALASKGEKPGDAMEKSFQRLVGDNLGFPMVHGQPVMVQKVRKDGTVRTDVEVADIGRQLTVALRDIPPQHIQTVDENGTPYFLTLPGLPENDPLRLQHLRDIITSSAFYRPSPDGQSVSVYLLDSDGIEFQLRDKQNRPLEIDLDFLPKFSVTKPSMLYMSWATLAEKPSATYSGEVKGWAPYWKNQQKQIPPRIKELRAP